MSMDTTGTDNNEDQSDEREEYGGNPTNEHEESDSEEQLITNEWFEAKYILHIKEKYILSQVAVDHVLASTKLLVSDILG